MNRFSIAIIFLVSMIFFGCGYSQNLPTGVIKGRVLDKATKQSIPGANVLVRNFSVGASTDTAGVFVIKNIEEGVYSLTTTFIGYQDKVINDVRVTRGKTNYLEIELEESPLKLDEIIVATFKYENSPTTPVSGYSFSREEISRNPGAQGDIFRAIGLLPGVSSSGGQFSAIAVRGQGVRDNVYMVDDIPFTEVGHLEGDASGFNDPNGGRFSIFAPRVIDNAQFQGGGFSALYGRKSASYLGLGIKEGNVESATVDGQLDLLGFTINYDGPSKAFKNTSLFASARVQDFKLLLNLIDEKSAGYPSYSDFILKTTTRLNSKNKLSVIVMYNPEKYSLTTDHLKEQDELQNENVAKTIQSKATAGLNLRTLIGMNSYMKNILYYRYFDNDFSVGKAYLVSDASNHIVNSESIPFEDGVIRLNQKESEAGHRLIFVKNFENNSTVTIGSDLAVVSFDYSRRLNRPDTVYTFDGNDFRPDPSLLYSIIRPHFYNAEFDDSKINVSAYMEYSFLLFKKLTINTGVRYDYTGLTQQYNLAPRISGNFQFTDKSSFNFAGGLFYQDPLYSQIADQTSVTGLRNEKVTQLILGYKYYFSSDLKFMIEPWYKQFDDMIIRPVKGSGELSNKGHGSAYGIDVNITKRLSKKYHGQVSYSYMQSKRNDHDGEGEYDFQCSQPHALNFLISYKANKRWVLSSKFRYATGRPTDKFIVHQNVFNNPNFIRSSQEITEKNGQRFDDFISLDIRVDYRTQIKNIGLTFFIDVVNISGRINPNTEVFLPRTGETYFDALGIFPTFGLKFDF